LEKFFTEQELQLTNAYEQNNPSVLPTLHTSLSGDQLVSKRRLSSDLFLKPMSTMKRTKPLINSNENDSNEFNENQRDSSSILTKKLSEEIK
jgi:hypothetical protein